MAKGLRSSTKKANKAILRRRVFGPVEDARKERLSVKLLELASKSQAISTKKDVKMIDDNQGLDGNLAFYLILLIEIRRSFRAEVSRSRVINHTKSSKRR